MTYRVARAFRYRGELLPSGAPWQPGHDETQLVRELLRGGWIEQPPAERWIACAPLRYRGVEIAPGDAIPVQADDAVRTVPALARLGLIVPATLSAPREDENAAQDHARARLSRRTARR